MGLVVLIKIDFYLLNGLVFHHCQMCEVYHIIENTGNKCECLESFKEENGELAESVIR